MLSARVSKPNTPESDQCARVWHIVTDNGVETELYAKDPMDAIDMYKQRLTDKENEHE